MQRHHTGSGRRQALPPGWGLAHAPVTATTRNAVGTFRRATTSDSDPDSGWDDTDRVTTPATGDPYAVSIPVRIQSLITHRSDAERNVAEETVIEASYLITADHDLPPLEGDEFTCESCDDDATLVGRLLRIEHVVRGPDRFERDMFANLLPQRPSS